MNPLDRIGLTREQVIKMLGTNINLNSRVVRPTHYKKLSYEEMRRLDAEKAKAKLLNIATSCTTSNA